MKESALSLRNRALLLLNSSCSEDVVAHSIAVSINSLSIARKIRRKGYTVDLEFVEVAALLHDIGRSRTHGIKHGIEGAEILRREGLGQFSRVCETHIGGGITRKEAMKMGLPKRDYLPETLEEKIIAHADNITWGTETVPVEKTIEKLRGRLGADHPAINRVRELSRFIKQLTGDELT